MTNELKNSKHVIVSAYYDIPGKLAHGTYLEFVQRFLRSVDSKRNDIVFFTNQRVFLEIKTRLDVSAVHFVLIELDQLVNIDFFNKHATMDIEKHSALLAAVWCEKMYFVKRAIGLFSDRQRYIWIDAGCVRDGFHEDLLLSFGSRNQEAHDQRLHLMQIATIPQMDFYSGYDKCIAAAIMYGSEKAWSKHIVNYRNQLIRYDSQGHCASKDQHLIKSCTDVSPEDYVLYKRELVPEEEPGRVNTWFFFLETV